MKRIFAVFFFRLICNIGGAEEIIMGNFDANEENWINFNFRDHFSDGRKSEQNLMTNF